MLRPAHCSLYLLGSQGVIVARLCPTLCDPMDRSLPGSSVHGILQARILEWVAISFSSSQERGRKKLIPPFFPFHCDIPAHPLST